MADALLSGTEAKAQETIGADVAVPESRGGAAVDEQELGRSVAES